MATVVIEKAKRPVGRPKGRKDVHCVNYHCDSDIFEWISQNKGDKSITQFINSILRKEAKL